MKTRAQLCLILCALISFNCFSPQRSLSAREFTSTDGKKMEATVVAINGANVLLKRGTKQFNVPANRFSLDDQSYFKKWAEDELKNLIPKLKVEVNNGKSTSSDRKDYYDDKKGSFQFSIKITNEEIHYNLKDAKASLSVLGEDCDDTKKYGIMQKSSFKVNAEPGKEFSWKGDSLHYKFDDHPSVVWGVKYYGYVFQIKNTDGKVIFSKSSQKKFETHVDKILDLGLNAGFDHKLNERSEIRIRKN